MFGLGLLGLMALAGCSSLLVTPTPGPPTPTATLAPTVAPPRPSPTRAPVQGPVATPEPGLPTVQFSGEVLQFWSNPNDISALVLGTDGLWAATGGGLVRWQSDGSYAVLGAREGLASQGITGLARDGEGRLWVGYAGSRALSVCSAGACQTYATREAAIEEHYAALLAAPAFDPRLWSARPGSTWLWLPRGDGRIEAYDGARWRVYGEGHGITPGSWGVAVAPDGQVWAVGRGVSTAQEGELYWDDHALFSEIATASEVTDLAADAEGALWLSFAADPLDAARVAGPAEAVGGVARYNLALNRWEGYLHSMNEAVPERVYQLRALADGTLLLAGEGAVAFRHPQRPWEALAAQGLTVRAMAQDARGDYWLGTAKGLWRMDAAGGDAQGPWLIPSPLPDGTVNDLALDAAGALLLATPRGVATLGADGRTALWTEDAALAVAMAPDGVAWVALADGLYRRTAAGKLERILAEPVVALAFDGAGQSWACTQAGWLRRADLPAAGTAPGLVNVLQATGHLPRNMAVDAAGAVWLSLPVGVGKVTPDGKLEVIASEEALLSPDVRRVAVAPDGTLWVATAKGVARLAPSGKWTRFTTESTEGGLRAMDVRDVRLTSDGSLWIATAAGVSRRTASSDWAYFDAPGLRLALADGQGAIWAAGAGGLYRILTSALVAVP